VSESAAALPYDLAVFVGRFQPFHRGHLQVVERALEQARHVLIVVGSADAARRADLIPFTADERREMILGCLDAADRARVTIHPLPDLSDLSAWAGRVAQAAEAAVLAKGLGPDPRITLIGCSKDRSSYYLKAFPQWDSIGVPPFDDLSATPGRLAYFDADAAVVDGYLKGQAPKDLHPSVVAWLEQFRTTAEYPQLVEELAWTRRYRKTWSAAPYPPTFVTADAVVVRNDEVLLIQRKGMPGRGLWALPGGFVEQDEFVIDAAIRELMEETALAVSEDDLRRAMAGTRVYDAPFRDMRGRVITHATLFRLASDSAAPPAAEAADDAADVRWFPLHAIRREMMFGDHFAIIQTLTGAQADGAGRGEG
jgi:bifunctional NMN adenylyltransferase/nudix hydrolase